MSKNIKKEVESLKKFSTGSKRKTEVEYTTSGEWVDYLMDNENSTNEVETKNKK